MLKLSHVSKTYNGGKVKAVDDLSLELGRGEIFGFLGPNGAGKTTTIKMLAGILSYDEGDIEICGHALRRDPIAAKRELGYVPDNEIIYDKLTGREYVGFMADIYGVSKDDRNAITKKLLAAFEMEQAFDSPIKSYSHGMKQKMAIIGALVHSPKLWVLDEPMTGLDPQSAFRLKELMHEHCREGNTVFFSTHVLEVAEKLCDRVGVIVKGKLVLCGSLEEIKAHAGDESLEEIFLSVTSDPSDSGSVAEEAKPGPESATGADEKSAAQEEKAEEEKE